MRHSEEHRSYYSGDECYYILQGSLTFHNPQTGEVYVVNEDETLHFRARTWHYGYNFATRQTLILMALAPLPPDLTAAAELAREAPPLKSVRNGRYELLGNWPWNAAEAHQTRTKLKRRYNASGRPRKKKEKGIAAGYYTNYADEAEARAAQGFRMVFLRHDMMQLPEAFAAMKPVAQRLARRGTSDPR